MESSLALTEVVSLSLPRFLGREGAATERGSARSAGAGSAEEGIYLEEEVHMDGIIHDRERVTS